MVEEQQEATPAPKPLPWYTLDPRAIGKSRLLRALLIGLVIVSFSVVPLWRAGWYWPIYSAKDFTPVRDAHGHWRAAWQWVYGREIRVYQAPDVHAGNAATIKQGVEALLKDLNLDFTVKVLPMPPAVLAAYNASTVIKTESGRPHTYISFNRLQARLIELRDNDPHADMLVVNAPMMECWWAHGMATITSGLGILEEDNVDFHLGKHESGHLLGYLNHDDLPLFVIGYPWESFPWNRDTLMMLYTPSTELSPRARDALTYFWRGMEKRTGRRFFKERK